MDTRKESRLDAKNTTQAIEGECECKATPPPPKSHIEGQGGAVWTFLSEEHLLFPSRPDAPS